MELHEKITVNHEEIKSILGKEITYAFGTLMLDGEPTIYKVQDKLALDILHYLEKHTSLELNKGTLLGFTPAPEASLFSSDVKAEWGFLTNTRRELTGVEYKK